MREGQINIIEEELINPISRGINKAKKYLKLLTINTHGHITEIEEYFPWDELFIDANIKELLDNQIVKPFQDIFHLRKHKVPLCKFILITGQYGTGKTSIGKLMASIVESTFIWAKQGEVCTMDDIKRTEDLAKELQPAIIFLDENHTLSGRNHFLSYPLEIHTKTDIIYDLIKDTEEIVVFVTHLEPFDYSHNGRFDLIINLESPKYPVRFNLIKRELNGFKCELERYLPILANKTDGYTQRELIQLTNNLKSAAIIRSNTKTDIVIKAYDICEALKIKPIVLPPANPFDFNDFPL